MRITSCSYTVFFPQLLNIRESFFDLENSLQEYFQKPMVLVPIPNDAPSEIPRITGVSRDNFTSLKIAMHNANIITNFDVSKKCQSINGVKEMRDVLNSAISKIFGASENFFFSGLVTNMEFEEYGFPVEFIRENFIKLAIDTKCPLYDVAFRVALVYEDDYFINIEVSNKRTFKGAPRGLSLAGLEEGPQSISVVLDINDRRAFNSKLNYTTNQEKMDRIFELSESMIYGKLWNFIASGDLRYE